MSSDAFILMMWLVIITAILFLIYKRVDKRTVERQRSHEWRMAFQQRMKAREERKEDRDRANMQTEIDRLTLIITSAELKIKGGEYLGDER
jgi:amino acid permease